ncbi:hydantoinase B/oxoprolinase [Botrytis cinerea]
MGEHKQTQGGIRIAIDRGGTFTDCVGNPGTGKMEDDVIIKLLSEDPSNYDDAPLEGIRRLMSKFLNKDIPRGEPLDTSKIESIRMGTTVATNALLERKGEKIAMVVTKGFKDLEIDERVTLEDYAEDPERSITKVEASGTQDQDLVRGLSSEAVRILQRPEEQTIRSQLQEVFDKGIKSVAVCLMHGYTFPDHEALVGKIAKEIGFEHVSLSHELMPMIKLYIAGFSKGFEGGLGAESVKNEKGTKGARCEFMQSDGGLVDVDNFSGLKAILSGPAGGVVGYALTSYDPETKIPVIGFDMGGTSTDVSRYGSGRYEHVFETTTAGVTIQSPQLDINTVAAGGGSRLFFKNGLFVVGPESAGAHPGPACYRKGGPAAVTDANLFLGRLIPDFFPKIFGKNEDEGLDVTASEKLLQELAEQVNKEMGKNMTADEVAYGFLTVANETMTRPIRSLTEAKGFDTSKHRLATFGGAGGQHAVAIAESLGIRQILVHRYSSVLSAYGMALADVVDEEQEPESKIWSDDGESRDYLKKKIGELKQKSTDALKAQGFQDSSIVHEEYLNMRYRGTESALMVVKPEKQDVEEFGSDEWAYGKAFIKQHQQEFGFTLPDRDIIVDDVRVRGIGKSFQGLEKTVDQQLKEIKPKDVETGKKEYKRSQVYFEGGRQDTPIYKLEDLDTGDRIKGPAILADGTQTVVITPGASALIIETHVVINIGEYESKDKPLAKDETKSVDPIMLSIFAHRFMAIAEQMGRALQKTSVSTNVKERLDYSCALFDSTGGLVANAPHLPVHLGSMSTCVKRQAEIWKGKLVKGDVIVSNHPEYGGTHLPDITVITPAFNPAGDKILFYVASRAHHADIGGILPGSMPPHSRELYQEGAAIKSEKLVSAGRFNEERMTQLLLDEPAQYQGCSGTRCLADNISDLKAQISSNMKGINLISTLIEEYGEEVVNFYMVNIQNNAELSVRNLLKDVSKRFEGQDLSAIDYMDDGSPIQLKITIDAEKGEAVFDFEGTGPEVYGNKYQRPQAVTYSAIIYCLRSLISEDIPLNQGCLKPITVLIPPKSFLSPSDKAAVVGGNVLTSQRVTDVILRAFRACAASQGDCNNLTFGFGGNVDGQKHVKGFGYYETIAGGSGAGKHWDGTSGVHTHMTNTRITDAEVFERRYPVLLREFSLRAGSGGQGKYKGGDGVIRDIEFRIPVQEGREEQQGRSDLVLLESESESESKKDAKSEELEYEERRINLGGKNTAAMKAGERIIIHTPGGGGWGKVGEEREVDQRSDPKAAWKGGSYASREELALQA